MRIVSTCREESLSQAAAIWEQLLAKKKERLPRSQAMRAELTKHGMCEEVCESFPNTSGTRKVGHREMKLGWRRL